MKRFGFWISNHRAMIFCSKSLRASNHHFPHHKIQEGKCQHQQHWLKVPVKVTPQQLLQTNAQCLPPPHVARICAPDQRTEVPNSNGLAVEGNRCKCLPICKKINGVCGGKTKERCLVYGLNSTMQMPYMEELEYPY
eukprot:scaffold4710_cov49-Attheya_sp.AAC.1